MNENIECVIRFGHCNGHTDCSFIDRNKLITSGVDSAVRIWPIKGQQIEDFVEEFPISDETFAIVSNSNQFFIACDSNCVKSYSINDGENETIVCRFETNATHLDISSDGKLLVASAADFTVKLINLETNDQKCFEGHDAPVLSVAIDPELRYIASSSCDASVRIWNIENQNCVHFWNNCFPKSNDFENSQTLSRISWKPIDGEMIAIPKLDRIDVYKRDTWDLVQTFKHEKLSQISIVSYSFDAKYLAIASNEGIVMIWGTESSNSGPIAQYFHKTKKITSLKWRPNSSKYLSFCDIGGEFGVLGISSSKDEDNHINISPDEMNDIFAEINDEDFAEETDDNRIENTNNEKEFELEKVEFNPQYKQQIEDRVKNTDNDNIGDNEDLEFDIGAIKSRYETQIFGETNDLSNDRQDISGPASRQSDVPVLKDTESIIEEPTPLRQEPFQSGSTPIHLENRFMVWNSVGIVRCTDTQNENSIDVEFHDTTYHHSIHLPNVQNYSIADLSNNALVLATNGDESATNGKLFCMLFNIWDATKEWQIEMPSEEFIESVACGSSFIAVVTDKKFVRIFTSGGIQTNIFSLSGRVVCLSAWEHFLLIAYHSSSGMPEEQSLSMIVLNMENKSSVKHPVPEPIPVALSPKSLVSWAGFTDEGTPCVVDSDGVIRIYNKTFGNTWFPIASTKEQANGKSNNFFVIGLSEIQNQIRCIFCKGCRYPATIPKPTLTLLPFRIPLCDLNTTKGKHEEEQMRSKILLKLLKKLSDSGFDVESNIEDCNKSLISASIKLFAMALGADRESLALEVSNLMPNKSAVEGAIKYAERQKRRTLVQQLTQIAEQKLEEEINQIEDEEEEELQQIEERTHISLNSRTEIEMKTNSSIQLKPKPMRRPNDGPSNLRYNSDDSNSDIERGLKNEESIDEDSNSVSLKPKRIQIPKHSNGNPFKVTQESIRSNKSKRERDSSDDSDDEETVPQGFQSFYSEMKQIIKDDNSDAEDEEELKTIALRQFRELDSDEKKGWAHKDSKNKKRKTKSDSCDQIVTNKENTNKITKFFTRN